MAPTRIAWAALLLATPALAQHDHATPKPRLTVADWADGARLFDGLGDFTRKVTTRSPEAQRYFDQGLRFVWAFNHDEATRSFARAATLDPKCASCFWGVALTLGPNYNMPIMADARARVGWSALQAAQANAAKATPVEQALVAALAARFTGAAPLDPSNSTPRLSAYATAMRGVAARFPDDADVQTLFAEGLMNTNPWKLWNADGTPGPGTPEIVATLETALANNPRHPGANHYWIHAIEASPNPGRGLPAAEMLTGMMPAAGHLEHMPSHIMQRVGRYEEAAEANRKGVAADIAYLGQTAPPDYYPMYVIHNYQFLAGSAAMAGRQAETIDAARKARASIPEAMLLAMPGMDWSIGYLYDSYARFGRWDDMLREPAPNPKLPGLTISYLLNTATANAATGRMAAAKAVLGRADALIAAVPADATQGLNAARSLYEIGRMKAAARIAIAEKRLDDAIALLGDAAAREDMLSYNEPEDQFWPVRHLLGAVLLDAGRAAAAEAVYRRDLTDHPANGWALAGLAKALTAQGRGEEAAAAQVQFTAAWRGADIALDRSAL